MTLLFDLMLNVREAYQEGKARQEHGPVEAQTQVQLQGQIVQQWINNFSSNDKDILDIHSGLIKAIIQATRQGKLTHAIDIISSDTELIARSPLSPDVRDVCQSQLLAATAYLEYKREQYDEALVCLLEALKLDAGFEERNPEFAFVPHLHRITLLNNWVRILARRQQCQEAISLAFQILDYLEQKTPSIAAPTDWDSSRLTAYSLPALSLMFRESTAELIDYITGADTLMSQQGPVPVCNLLVIHACQHIQSEQCHLSNVSHCWLHMKQASLVGDVSRALDLATNILSEGPGQWQLAWYATVVEVVALSQQYQDTSTISFRRQIAEDAASWKRLPPAWRSIITTSKDY